MHALLVFVALPITPSPSTPDPDIHGVVRFTGTTIVYKTPSKQADRAGIVGGGTRSAVQHTAPAGDGCTKDWIEIEPRGWACGTSVAVTEEASTRAAPPSLTDDAEPELGVYGAVYGKDVVAYDSRADAAAGENGHAVGRATSVRAAGTTAIDGRTFWITTEGLLIDATSIAQMAPSKFHGAAIPPEGIDGKLAVAWVHRHDKPRDAAVLRDAAGHVTGEVGPRVRVTVKEITDTAVRITDSDWIAREDVRVASVAAPPPGVGAHEKWFDVDLDEQILVAYEGTRPVYATLVSTGKTNHATPEAIARISSKLRTADMNSTKIDVYSVADVPWTMYYDNNFALHTSYWHDGFGDVRSHGCVNLAPRDARALYGWSSPDVPPGWIAVYGDDDNPGSLVRVRSKRVPDPAYRGYAKALHDAANGQVASR